MNRAFLLGLKLQEAGVKLQRLAVEGGKHNPGTAPLIQLIGYDELRDMLDEVRAVEDELSKEFYPDEED
jgi:hypothetical protein